MGTKEKIIAAARELFEQKGFAATTTKEVAALAGVSEVTLYRHFESKRSLFIKTLHSCFHPYTIDDYLKDGVTYDLGTDLKHIAYALLNTYKKNASMIRIVMRDKIRGTGPELEARRSERHVEHSLLRYFSAMHEAGCLNAEPEMALKLYITNIFGYFLRRMLSFEGDEAHDDEYFDWMVGSLIGILENKDLNFIRR